MDKQKFSSDACHRRVVGRSSEVDRNRDVRGRGRRMADELRSVREVAVWINGQ